MQGLVQNIDRALRITIILLLGKLMLLKYGGNSATCVMQKRIYFSG